jgi:hypothetical protein
MDNMFEEYHVSCTIKTYFEMMLTGITRNKSYSKESTVSMDA